MSEPVIAKKGAYPTDVEAGKKYFWCTCGQSKKQPFCDGSHTGTDFSPMVYEAQETKRVFFCGCKKSAKSPVCDGSHNRL